MGVFRARKKMSFCRGRPVLQSAPQVSCIIGFRTSHELPFLEDQKLLEVWYPKWLRHAADVVLPIFATGHGHLS